MCVGCPVRVSRSLGLRVHGTRMMAVVAFKSPFHGFFIFIATTFDTSLI